MDVDSIIRICFSFCIVFVSAVLVSWCLRELIKTWLDIAEYRRLNSARRKHDRYMKTGKED